MKWASPVNDYWSAFFSVFLHFRMEPSSTWRASTTRRWSTTLFWLTADTLTRTHSITATLGDAERGTACRLASADRNHSSPLTLPPSPLWPLTPALHPRWKRTGRQTEDQRPAVFALGLLWHRTTALSSASSSHYLYLSISAWLFSLWLTSVLRYFQYCFPRLCFRSLSVCFLYFCGTRCWWHCHVQFLTSFWPLRPSCLWVFCFVFLQFIHFRTNRFSFCAIHFFSRWQSKGLFNFICVYVKAFYTVILFL